MKFHAPLIEGVLIQRYKRFLADVRLPSGEVVVAHCANSGSMLSVNEPGSKVWLSPAADPARKLRYTWELIEVNGALVGINTAYPNRIVAEAIASGAIKELAGYDSLKREQKYGRNSRIDILLESPGRPPCFVEIKNVTMRRGFTDAHKAEFPDAVTARGAKHLLEMADMVKKGARAVMFYLVQRTDCATFKVAGDIDPAYEKGLREALAAGVEAIGYSCDITPDGITLARPLTLDLPVTTHK
ncbi:MAG: DNA/RNA nuclease SfsA [Rhodospirillaceae bacterium]